MWVINYTSNEDFTLTIWSIKKHGVTLTDRLVN